MRSIEPYKGIDSGACEDVLVPWAKRIEGSHGTNGPLEKIRDHEPDSNLVLAAAAPCASKSKSSKS